MSTYYSEQAGSASKPAPAYSVDKRCTFRVKVDFAALRTSAGVAHTTGVVSTDHIGVITIPKGAMLTSLGLYTPEAISGGQVDLSDGTTTFLSNASLATAETQYYPDTNPMADYFYTADTLLYLNADATMTSGVVWVFGEFYMAMDENDM